MLKLLVVGLPMLCQSTTPDLIAGWKMDDNGKVCVCDRPCDSLTQMFCGPACAADFMLIAYNSVHSGGRNIGSDPDQNVRFQMMRDDNSRYGGAD